MKILELFCGTKSFSNVAEAEGHEVFTVDIESKFNPTLCINILDFDISMLNGFKPDFIWASPPCTTFSVASISHYWTEGKPKNDKCLQGIEIVKKTIEIIKELNPKFWVIENPRGMLRKQDFMGSIHKDTVTYCQYGATIQKPTDLWNNLNHTFKPMCKPGASCHQRAGRGSRTGVQGIYSLEWERARGNNATARGKIPKELCLEILNAIKTKGLNT
jgi:site-specific DNA-cytosine methylase